MGQVMKFGDGLINMWFLIHNLILFTDAGMYVENHKVAREISRKSDRKIFETHLDV